jgi:hypothetical protein
MSLFPGPWVRAIGALATAALAAVACGGSSATSSASPSPHMAMELPPWAMAMKVAIQSPTDGTKITDNTVPVHVSISGFQATCASGFAPVQGEGHYHLLIDKSLVDMFCAPDATLSMQNLQPGTHTITAQPALTNHMDVEMNASSVTIDYEPTHALPALTAATFPGAPSIKIMSPAKGTQLSGAFDISVQVSNYNVSCALEGKPDVAGYGHWHVNLETLNSGMMGMETMARMSCQNVLHMNTQGFPAGHHLLIVYLTDDQHAPLMPEVMDSVDVVFGS